jgi:PAS domain-containing protein
LNVNNEAYLLVIVRDTTERKEGRAQIPASRHGHRAGRRRIILITDADGIIEYVNPALRVRHGYVREEVIGRRPDFLVSGLHDRELYRTSGRRSGPARSLGRVTIVNRRKTGPSSTRNPPSAPSSNPRAR